MNTAGLTNKKKKKFVPPLTLPDNRQKKRQLLQDAAYFV